MTLPSPQGRVGLDMIPSSVHLQGFDLDKERYCLCCCIIVITLLRSITTLCGIDIILQNIIHIQFVCGEYST